jgi:hypothetical protein
VHLIDEVLIPGDGFENNTDQLTAVMDGDKLTLVWAFVLGENRTVEMTEDLANPNWVPVDIEPVTADGISKISVTPSMRSGYFRLVTDR